MRTIVQNINFFNGIIEGNDDGTFGVGSSLIRQDAAVIIDRCVKSYLRNGGSDVIFTDDDMISDYAKDAVYRTKKGEIISGMGDGRFAPTDNLTRAQAAVLINNMITKATLISAGTARLGTASGNSMSASELSEAYKLYNLI